MPRVLDTAWSSEVLRVLFVELPQGSETAAENPEASVFFGAGRIVRSTAHPISYTDISP
jgi:hypothetical protein